MDDCEKCDTCHKPFGVKKKRKREYKRRVIDPITNKLLVMCNACGLRLSRGGWKSRNLTQMKTVAADTNISFSHEGFMKALFDVLQDGNANRLWCPVVTPKLCNCIQLYLIKEVSSEGTKDVLIDSERAVELNELHKKAKELIKMKVPRPDNKNLTLSEIRGVVHLRTKEYEEFVLANRERLKNIYNFCERAVQRVLCYSNNYLHKQLKTSPNGEARIASKSSSIAKVLPDIASLSEKKCCSHRCTRLVLTHRRLVERWRKKALLSQRDTRTVLGEMLTPAGGAINCFSFLQLVTGCSLGLFYKVRKDMRQSSGMRDPPEHGLREYWRRKKLNAARSSISDRTKRCMPYQSVITRNVSSVRKINIEPLQNTNESLQASRSVICKAVKTLVQVPNEISTDSVIDKNCIDINSNNNCSSSNETTVLNLLTNIDYVENLPDDVQINSNEQNESNLLSLNLLPANNDIGNTDRSTVEDIDSRFQLIESVVATNTIPPLNNVQSTVDESTNIAEMDVPDNEQNVQFIEITKVPSDIPDTREEVAPLESVILLTPGCFLVGNDLIVATKTKYVR